MMRVYFDLSPGSSDTRPAHIKGWESFLSRVAEGDDAIVSDPSTADVIIYTAAPGVFDSSLWSSIRPLSQREIFEFVWDWADAPLGRMSGFYCSLPRTLFDSRRHRSMSYPLDFNELVDEFPADDAIYSFGFVGGMTSGVRARIFSMFEQSASSYNALIRRQAGDWAMMLDRSGLLAKHEYADAMRRTKFTMCPRGAGVGSIRLFEALKAGRPPVIISDGYVLPEGIDWDACALRVRERDIAHIPRLVEARLPEWRSMAMAARQVWLENFSDARVLNHLTREITRVRRSLHSIGIGDRTLVYSGKMTAHLVHQKLRPLAGSLISDLRR